MPSSRALILLASALSSSLLPACAAPAPQASSPSSIDVPYWFAEIDHTKDSVWNGASGYTVFRDVTKDPYNAKGDGVTDDTDAINRAISDGNRCGGAAGKCDSSTTTPAIVYFPTGNYSVKSPIQMYYLTQLIGNANKLPTIQASEDFSGMAVLDSDPYDDSGANWYTNQNNFYRQVRNFNIDVSRQGRGNGAGSGIHWQVAQATSLQNINFIMSTTKGNTQQGIFMDNGSGGFFSNLTFTGGKYGAFLGSQQFTTRDLTFTNCDTAIYMNWNWGWTIQGITVTGATTGIDMSNTPQNQTVGSVVLADSSIDAQYGVRYAWKQNGNIPANGGTLLIDHTTFSGGDAVVDSDNTQVLAGNTMISSWAAGNGYANKASATNAQGTISPPTKASGLLDSNQNIYSRVKPQYENLQVTDFITAKSNGCAGNGNADDTAAIQSFLTAASSQGKVAYFEHGAYRVTNTIVVPNNIKITGSIWPLIVADGSSPAFSDSSNPKPVFQIGKPGDTGAVEISDLIFETLGAAPGAILIEWNLQTQQGASGVWDTHARVGGSKGTGLELDQCSSNNTAVSPNCEGVFLMFHATPQSSNVYLENTWFWVADHELDAGASHQLSIYSARGMLIQSQGPVWLWGTASEHSLIYNYQFDGVKALFSGFMQSETPYMQPNPLAPSPFTFNSAYDDPTFTVCSNSSAAGSTPCKDSWGLRVLNSQNVLIYGTGLYSFFNDYEQNCLATESCQENMVHIQNSEVDMYAVSTKAAVNMIVDDGLGVTVKDADNRSNFCATLAYFFTNS